MFKNKIAATATEKDSSETIVQANPSVVPEEIKAAESSLNYVKRAPILSYFTECKFYKVYELKTKCDNTFRSLVSGCTSYKVQSNSF